MLWLCKWPARTLATSTNMARRAAATTKTELSTGGFLGLFATDLAASRWTSVSFPQAGAAPCQHYFPSRAPIVQTGGAHTQEAHRGQFEQSDVDRSAYSRPGIPRLRYRRARRQIWL